MRLLLLLCILLCIGSRLAVAQCECLWHGSFSDVQAATDLVVSGTIITRKGNSVDLAVDRQLRGTGAADEVRIWLRAADYCRPEADLFPVGSTWVMALHKITEDIPGGFNPNTPNISYGRLGDYSLSSCGGYWLSLSDNRVTGALVNAPRWDREPAMTPVLLDLVADYVRGKLDRDALLQASKADPALRELMLDTRAFLRNGN